MRKLVVGIFVVMFSIGFIAGYFMLQKTTRTIICEIDPEITLNADK